MGNILCACIPKDKKKVSPKYLHWYLSALKDALFIPLMTGTANVSMSVEKVKTVEVIFPPLDVQNQIVERLNELSTLHTQANATLARLQTDVKRLRQSILQQAIQGKLVDNTLPPGEKTGAELLADIRAEKERRAREQGKKPDKPLPPVTEAEMPFELPEGWVWCRLREILVDLKYGTSKPCNYDSSQNAKVLRIPNVVTGVMNDDDLKFTDLTATEILDLSLTEDDLLVIRSNGSRELVGKMARASAKFVGFCFAGYLIRLRLFTSKINPAFVNLVFESTMLRKQIEGPLRTTVGVNNINSTELSNLIIPLPAMSIQNLILKSVTQQFNQAQNLSAGLEKVDVRLSHLWQSEMQQIFKFESNGEAKN